MSFHKFIKHFSDGKVLIKYHIVIPRRPVKARNVLIILALIFFSFLIIGTVYVLKIFDLLNIWGILFAISILFIPKYLVNKFILNYSIIGRVEFHHDQLTILTNQLILNMKYDDIYIIEYRGNLIDDFFTKVPKHKTYIVRFYVTPTHFEEFEITRDMFMTKNEQSEFKRNLPILDATIVSIKPKFGVNENRAIKKK